LVKTFSTEAKEHKEYEETQDDLVKHQTESEIYNWLLETGSFLWDQLATLALIWYGGILIFQGMITVGEFSVFNMYALKFNSAVSTFKNEFGILKDDGYSASVSEFIKILLENEEKKERGQGILKKDLEGDIEVKEVSFNYITKPGVEILSRVSLKIKKGQSVAIVGANGSGKTTLSYLLQGLYTPKEGTIKIDGEDIQKYDLKWLRRQIGYVSQEPVLLDKTIERNLVYGLHGEESQQRIERALTLANARFVMDKKKFPDGLQTRLGRGEKSVKLSGGQRQRVAIARAFIKDPKILILDEPTSALDGESESKVQKAIDELMALGDRTVIVIAHRLSTIINCDKIVVMDEGKIVEEGTHKELFAKEDGVYKKLFEFQINSMKNNM